MKPDINKTNTIPVLDKKYIRVFDFQYAEGKHYYNATRRSFDELAALKSDEDFRNMLPDAVTCVVILKRKGGSPKLLLAQEYRYPAGRFLLSPPAGLIDPSDCSLGGENPLIAAAKREIREETGIIVDESADISVINPLLFSSPGMTDESNAIVKVTLDMAHADTLSQDGAEGSECFDGFVLLSKEEAQKLLADGCDGNGFFYSVYTWIALQYFISHHDEFQGNAD